MELRSSFLLVQFGDTCNTSTYVWPARKNSLSRPAGVPPVLKMGIPGSAIEAIPCGVDKRLHDGNAQL
eukprot:COSAG02_NODE_2811_length_7976_cov_8.590199_2_plen_68_part_00